MAPTVSSTGTLTYSPTPGANGVATIIINLKDNGGTANGGADTSPVETPDSSDFLTTIYNSTQP